MLLLWRLSESLNIKCSEKHLGQRNWSVLPLGFFLPWTIAYSPEIIHLGIRSPPYEMSFAKSAKSLQSCPTLCDPIDGAHQAPPSLGFSRQEHWSGLPFPSPEMSFETALSLHAGSQPPPLQIWFLSSYSFSLAGNSSHIPRWGKPSICHRKFLYKYIKVTVENIQPLILWVPRTSVYTWQILWNFLWL